MQKKIFLELPKQLWTEYSLELTTHQYHGKLLDQDQGFELGKAQRKITPRSELSQLSERPKGVDALTVYHWSNQGRVDLLKPVRAKRMSVSPFAYFRGMPSLMLYDLAWEKSHSGLMQ